MNALIVLGIAATTTREAAAFHVPTPNSQSLLQTSSNSRHSEAWVLQAAAQPSLVSVCTAELCCCQEDGMGGDEILTHLQSRNLPFPVDEAPCLGACGGGAMVAIDFEDGSSALVSGIDETLTELGLSPIQSQRETTPSTFESTATMPSAQQSLVELATTTTKTLTSQKHKPEPKSKQANSSVELVDVRDRMRAEAAAKEKDEEPANPWLNAASYLAGKAAEKLFGDTSR